MPVLRRNRFGSHQTFPGLDWRHRRAKQAVAPPKRWDSDGRVIKQQSVTEGPYTEIKESLGGLLFIRAESYDDAVEIAKGCPVLQWGATVVRMALTPPVR